MGHGIMGTRMLVKLYGFALKSENIQISLNDLFASLASTSGNEDKSLALPRRIYFDYTSDPDFAVGLVVTIKDQKTYCELVSNNNGKFVVSVTNLKGKNKLMEFNFFLINKSNGHGIYQHYFHSCSPGTFAVYLKKRFRFLSDKSRDNAIQSLKAGGLHTAAKEKQVRSDHARGLSFSLLVHKKSLESVLKEFKKIKGFEYEVAALQPEYIAGAPISDYINRLRQKVTFKPTVGVGVLAKAIQSTVEKLSPRSGHVSVVDEIDGEEIPASVRIANIPENFGEEDYDVIATKMNNLDVDKFSSHKIVKELKDKCRDTYKHIFMKKVKDKK